MISFADKVQPIRQRLVSSVLPLAVAGLLALRTGSSASAVFELPELILQAGHSSKAEAMAFSLDGRYVATGGVDTAIKIWDAATGRVLRTLGGHAGGVKAVAFSPEGRLLASGGNDGRIRLWELASGNEAEPLPGHAGAVSALAFSRDGQRLASGGADTKVRVWNLSTRKAREFEGHFGQVFAVAFSPDGAWLASGGADKTVFLWDLTKKESKDEAEPNEPLGEHKGWVRGLAFSPDGRTLVSCGSDHRALLWKIPGGKLLKTIPKQAAPLLAAAFTADGTQLLLCAEDRTIKRFDVATGNELQAIPDRDHLAGYGAAAFSADGRWLAASGGERAVELRPVAPNGEAGEARALESHVNPVNAAAFSPDRRWFASANQDGTVTLWDLVTGRAIAKLGDGPGQVNAIAFSLDSGRLASGSGNAITVWDVVAACKLREWNAHADRVTALAFATAGNELISASADSTIKVWETANWKELTTFTEHKRGVMALGVSGDGRWLASAGADQSIRLWDLASRRAARTLNGHGGAVFAVAFSADGKTIASASADQSVRVWDAASGVTKETLTGLAGIVYSVAISPDGGRIAAGGAGGEIKVWKTDSGRQISSLPGHVGSVNGLRFDAGGNWLASCGEDGSVRLWKAETGEPAATLVSLRAQSKPGGPDWLVVTPDGFFDGSPAAWGQILWRFGRNTYNAAPVEIFFNEFFHPDLLADVLAGKAPRAARDISRRDRRQPRVRMFMEETAAPVANRSITVKLEVSEAPADTAHPAGSGARDVRLFRNGSLVKVWRDDVLDGRGVVTLTHTLPIVAGENRLTAYAFNRDNIKSADETRVVTGAESLRRRGVLYLLAVGINQYANPDYNLRYAVKDAQAFSETLRRQQSRLNRFSEIVLVTLLDQQATKDNLIAALKRLAGDVTLPGGAPPDLARLKPVQSEDTVIVFYAGHGMAWDDRFYLIPHDLGYGGSKKALNEEGLGEILAHSLSDQALETLFEGVDAAQLLLIIDACNSGQAIEAERLGPMNSKGLAQLAYEKGMNILTAAQSDQPAREPSWLKHGYLTYALVEEGVNKLAADYRPKDGEVRLREWFDFATVEVPRLQEARIKAERDRAEQEGIAPREIELRELVLRRRELQRPKVFYRREPEPRPLVIATQVK